MRSLLLSALLIAALGSPAFATGSKSSSRSTSVANSASVSNSQANNAGNNQTTTFQDRRQAPGIGGVGLATGGNVCLGSISGGLSGPGFGALFGTTTEDRPCNIREYAKLLVSLGYRREAASLLQADPLVAEAFRVNRPGADVPLPPQRQSAVAPFDLGSGR